MMQLHSVWRRSAECSGCCEHVARSKCRVFYARTPPESSTFDRNLAFDPMTTCAACTTMRRPRGPDRVMLYNAACALTYLAHRARTSPDERSRGRTLDEDLQWSTAAVEGVVGGRVP